MIATIADVARQVVAAIDSDAGYLLAARWVAARYQQLCSRTRFRHLRRVGQVNIDGALKGTAAFTNDSTTVTVSDAASVALLTGKLAVLPRRWVRGKINWYEIVEARPSGATIELTLNVAYTEETSAAEGFEIIHRYVSLDPEARWIGEQMLLMPRSVAISHMTLAELDLTYPRRPIVSGFGPTWWVDIGVDPQGTKWVEFYPYSSQDFTISYVYWSVPPMLGEEERIPVEIDPYVLREGALIDAMRYESSKAARQGNVEMAAFWSNSYRAQTTQWERHIMEALRADRGVDDITFLMRTTREFRPRDVVSARDEIYARGNRP